MPNRLIVIGKGKNVMGMLISYMLQYGDITMLELMEHIREGQE